MTRKNKYRTNASKARYSWSLVVFFVLIVLLALTQYALWFGERSIPSLLAIKQRASEAQTRIEAQSARNDKLKTDVYDLETGTDAIEERARSQMGLVKEGETFIYFGSDGDGIK